jgi:hypothetical protein
MHYACLLSIGAFNSDLFSDLVTCFGWRGLVWGAWLAALRPQSEFQPILTNARPAARDNNKHIIDIALAGLGGERPPYLEEHIGCVEEIRLQLKALPLPKVPLRRCPDESPGSVLDCEKERLRRVNAEQGADSANRYLKTTLLYEYLMSYPEWHRYVPKKAGA